jgi:hypothetical protein
MAGESELVVAPRSVEQTVPCFVVTTDDGTQLRVPVSSEANRLQSQIIASRLRKFIDQQLDIYQLENKKQKPAVIKDLVQSVLKAEEVARFAYAPGLLPKEGGENTSAMDAVKAAAQGMTSALIESQERRKKIEQLGKPKIVTEAKDDWAT